jgi:hypothetical protein
MTASPGREVDANLLRGAAPESAQACAEPQDAGRHDLGDLVEALGGRHQVGVEGLAHAGRRDDGLEAIARGKIAPPGDKLQ